MTDFLPYGESGPAGAPAESGGGGNRKALLGALVGVLVLALVGYFVVLPALSGGDDTASPVAVTVNKKAPKQPAKKATAAKPAAPKRAVTTTYNDTPIRDPFKPLWLESNGSATAPGAVAPGTVTPGTTTPGTSAPPSGSGSTGSSTVVSGQRVALIKVFARDGKTYAQTRVGETVYTPAVGEQFAGNFQLLATSGRSATFLFGDEQFNLSEGQEVLK